MTLLEKDRYPRFHIGESLLPMNLPILQRLGVLDEIARIGVLKVGADFPAPSPEGYKVFRFDRALDPTWANAYQVRRDEFDSVLGVHLAKNRVPLADGSAFERLVSRQATEYLLAMGVSPELFAIMSQVPHDEVRGLTRGEALRHMLVNE